MLGIVTNDEPRLIRAVLRFERNFTQLPNTWGRDERLSRRAKGLIFELMTHEDGREITLKSLVDAGPEGKDALNVAIDELERHGYLTRERLRSRTGILMAYTWTIRDPFDPGPQLVEPVHNPGAENPPWSGTRAENPLPTGAENPLPIEHKKNTPRESSKRNHRAPVDNSMQRAQTVRIPHHGTFGTCYEQPADYDPRYCLMGHVILGNDALEGVDR